MPVLSFIQSLDSQVWIATLGGFAIKIADLSELAKVEKTQRPDFGDWLYWVPFFVAPLLGGLLAFVYLESNIELESLVAFNIGVSAPLILRNMAQVNPLEPSSIDPGEGA